MLPRYLILILLACSFAHGEQLEENQTSPVSATVPTDEAGITDDPLIKASDIIQKRERRTIGASVENAGNDYDASETLERLQTTLSTNEDLSGLDRKAPQTQRINSIAVAFVIEFLVTFLVLIIAFQLSGFTGAALQLASFSLAVALFGGALDILIGAPPLNPIRAIAGLVILIALIRQFTTVRKWPTAIKIAVTTRIISLAVIWLLTTGLSALGQL